MSQESRLLPSIDLDAPDPRTSNRKTPSRKRLVNSLPLELLIMIFRNCCDFDHGPVSLGLVCRFWHTTVSASPALWTCINFRRLVGLYYHQDVIYYHSILCETWSDLERALLRAGVATLSLLFELRTRLYPRDEEGRVLSLFGRCRNLQVVLKDTNLYTFASSITMPHLEHIVLKTDRYAHIEPLIDSIESRSPLVRSLSIDGCFPTNLAQREPLLRRIVHLVLCSTPDDNLSFFRGLQNLEELAIRHWSHEAIEIPPSTLPKLVSLEIKYRALHTSQLLVTFPVLETLTLWGKWSNLRFIAAPKLRNLVLISRDERESEEQTMSTLRQTTVRPMSFSTDFTSDTCLPELLEMWSSLSELHLRGWGGRVCILGPIATAALAGSDVVAPLCSSLRYLTVHMKQTWKDLKPVNQGIQRLQTIVEERKNHGVAGLQRVMCVWDYWQEDEFRYNKEKEVEWVDIL